VGADRGLEIEQTPDVVYCARHPQVETYLRCGRCDTPICPRCLVQTPVGARCRDCANVSRLPTFNVTPAFFARGMTAALVSGVAVGALWALITGGNRVWGGFFVIILMGLAIGWAISEAVSLAANRKRGLGLQVCAVLGVVLAYLVYEFLAPGDPRIASGGLSGGAQLDLVAAGIGAFFAASRLRGF
jgi:hypothetical protein